ncbi:MAG: carbohydrate deacetylase, partial [Candidatus Entotheonellia bacterium]
MNRKLIITADDYGLCRAVNDAIEECLMAGTVRATCVMMNMPFYHGAAALRCRFPHRSVGIHWTLTQGRPILPAARVSSLVARDGCFYPPARFRSRWMRGQIRRGELRAELRAQHERFYAMAGVPDFWNTHQNVHVFPGLFEVCVQLGRELGIPAMRSHRRLVVPSGTTPARYHLLHPLYWLKGWMIGRWSDRAEAQGVQMPDGRVYMPRYAGINAKSLEEVVTRLRWSAVRRAVEVIIHPATTIQNELFGGLRESRVLEYQT